MKVIFIRHAETMGNMAGRYVGTQDLPVCEKGLRTLRLKGTYSNIKKVYASNMLRTMQTASALFPEAEIEACPGLREIDFGKFQNADKRMCKPDLYNSTNPFPGGESIPSLLSRVSREIVRGILTESMHNKNYAIFVMHGVGIMAMLQAFSQERRTHLFAWQTGNVCGWSFDTDLASFPEHFQMKHLTYHEDLSFLTQFM